MRHLHGITHPAIAGPSSNRPLRRSVTASCTWYSTPRRETTACRRRDPRPVMTTSTLTGTRHRRAPPGGQSPPQLREGLKPNAAAHCQAPHATGKYELNASPEGENRRREWNDYRRDQKEVPQMSSQLVLTRPPPSSPVFLVPQLVVLGVE